MEKNDGGQAFPCAGSEHNYPYAGMTLRDYFAAKAMASLLSNSDAMDEAADGAPDLLEALINLLDDPLGDREPARKAIARAKGEK